MHGSKTVKVGIVGFGLIGGSIAKALRRYNEQGMGESYYAITAFSHDEHILDLALEADDIARAALIPKIGSKAWEEILSGVQAIFEQDILILCLPVEWIPSVANLVAKHSPCLITDVGSVKSAVVEACQGLNFVGGHPMAGSERTGYLCSSASMFENARYVLSMPEDSLADSLETKVLLEDYVHALGAMPLWLNAKTHDALVAKVSHLPHVVASALVNTALTDDARDLAILLSAGGFRDITRIASSDASLWAGICLESGNHLIQSIDEITRTLSRVKEAVQAKDLASLEDFFQSANTSRQLIPAKGVGPLLSDVQILVNITDTTGALAKMTRILSEAKVDIHNIAIQDARQYEGGHVRLFISSAEQAEVARRVLQEEGYDIES